MESKRNAQYGMFVVYIRSAVTLDIDLCLSLLCYSGRKP